MPGLRVVIRFASVWRRPVVIPPREGGAGGGPEPEAMTGTRRRLRHEVSAQARIIPFTTP